MDIYQKLDALRKERKVCALCIVVQAKGSSPQKIGAKMIVFPNGEVLGSVGGGALEWEVIQKAREAIRQGKPRLLTYALTKDLNMACGGQMQIYIEPQQYRPRFLIYGAGHIGKALYQVMHLLDYEIHVFDKRTSLLTEASFKDAQRHPGVFIDEALLKSLGLYEEKPWIVICTHDPQEDLNILAHWLERNPRQRLAYLGVIASKSKRKRFEKALMDRGLGEEALKAFRAPVGLDIHALTPMEIAISIAAECIEVRRTQEKVL